jgi:hypothetical protein
MDESLFGETAEPQALEQAQLVPAQARRVSRPPQRRLRVLTLEGEPGQTSGTRPARLYERPYDMISYTEMGDIGADFSDDPGHLVAKYSRGRNDIVGGEQEVGVTEPGCLHIDQHLATDRSGNVDVFFKIESAPDRVDDECLHRWPPECVVRQYSRGGSLCPCLCGFTTLVVAGSVSVSALVRRAAPPLLGE